LFQLVRRRRGGFCYELNGLFAWGLRELGFNVDILHAAFYSNAQYKAYDNHMAMVRGYT
jgi:N-hydroxyarylamine O-acetyltransferase